MRIDTWNEKMAVDVDIDEVLATLVDHFRDCSEEDLYFTHHGTEYVLTVKELREPASEDQVNKAIECALTDVAKINGIVLEHRMEKLTSENSHKILDLANEIYHILRALKGEWRLRE